jgi:iron complex outermembrane recepter protein
VNGQAALAWHYEEGATLRGSISSRTRFATIFERFSTRFGTAVPNPDLATERAINYEIAWDAQITDRSHLSAAVFYNDVRDMIQTVIVATTPSQLTQAQNVGDGEFYGVELGGDSQVLEQLRVGFSYSYLHREIEDPLQPAFKPTGTPTNQAFVFARYAPVESLSITPSVEYADDRWSDVTGGGYRKVGAYTLLNLQAEYTIAQGIGIALGAHNLLDKNFELAWGFPEQGRSYYVKLKADF